MTAADAKKGKETELAKKRRARVIDRLLAAAHPDAHCELDYANPL
ncbi:MAG: endonuclease III, partial [Glycomyces artemisiae]|nr:endonuclease III [Glycomyces artemisiae]